MSEFEVCAQRAMEHVRVLAGEIGARGSCTPAEEQAAAYAARQMEALGLEGVVAKPFGGAPSTYRPYALAFATALRTVAMSNGLLM